MEPPANNPQSQPQTPPPMPAPAPPPPTASAPGAPAAPASEPATGIFRGRIGRLGYVMFLVYTVAAFVLALLLIFVPAHIFQPGSVGSGIVNIVAILIGLGLFVGEIVFGIGVTIRRWHDIGQSGWFILLSLIPVVSLVVAILMFVLPGTAGANKFGPPYSGGANWRSVLGLK